MIADNVNPSREHMLCSLSHSLVVLDNFSQQSRWFPVPYSPQGPPCWTAVVLQSWSPTVPEEMEIQGLDLMMTFRDMDMNCCGWSNIHWEEITPGTYPPSIMVSSSNWVPTSGLESGLRVKGSLWCLNLSIRFSLQLQTWNSNCQQEHRRIGAGLCHPASRVCPTVQHVCSLSATCLNSPSVPLLQKHLNLQAFKHLSTSSLNTTFHVLVFNA